jgi:endonuclease YncB( thermonuclease family)
VKRVGIALLALAIAACDERPPRLEELRQDCRAIDGDSLLCGDLRVRLAGVDTPELHGRCAAEVAAARLAQQRLADLAAAGIALRPLGFDRYARTLAIVVTPEGRNVASLLIREDLGRPYDGRGPRPSWCAAQLPTEPATRVRG